MRKSGRWKIACLSAAALFSVMLSGRSSKRGMAEGQEMLQGTGKTAEGMETDFAAAGRGAAERKIYSGTIPEELEYIPKGYKRSAKQQGRLEKLEYRTYESFSYESRTQELTKEAWVYVPYGYSEEEKYNVFYLSHGGWSDETTIMGTPEDPHVFKHVMNHAVEDGKIKPLLILLPTYNNTSGSESGSYSLALQLTDNFHNELVNDLIPAVESKYSTYAESTDPEGLADSRYHREFGGFSMGSVNTWYTFEYCLDYFRYFMPMSGSLTTDGEYMADVTNGTFVLADSEQEGNLSFKEREGYVRDGNASNEYTYKEDMKEIAKFDIGHSEIVNHFDPAFVRMLHGRKIHS